VALLDSCSLMPTASVAYNPFAGCFSKAPFHPPAPVRGGILAGEPLTPPTPAPGVETWAWEQLIPRMKSQGPLFYQLCWSSFLLPADEMGLGKTVELLATLIANPYTGPPFVSEEVGVFPLPPLVRRWPCGGKIPVSAYKPLCQSPMFVLCSLKFDEGRGWSASARRMRGQKATKVIP
jgi:hypothetical protein